MFATFLEVLDTTVVNVSLPHIAGSLSATPEEATWTLTSYLVANAIVRPKASSVACSLGVHHLFLSVRHCAFADLSCGASPSPGADWWCFAAHVAGDHARSLSGGTAWQGNGVLGAWDCRGSDSRPGSRRMANCELQLAVGF